MTKDEIMQMDSDALESRVAEIRTASEAEDADCNALLQELDMIEERRAALKQEAEQRAALAAKVAGGEVGKVIETIEEAPKMEERIFTPESKEYRDAWLKWTMGRENEMNEAEKRTMTTGLPSAQSLLVPTEIMDNIWDLVFGEHCILGDLNTIRANTVVEVIKHTASSGASKPDEGAAPSEETNTFAKVTLSGVDYAKYVDITYAMANMSLPALQTYIQTEIAKAIGESMAEDAVTNIEAGINAANKVTGGITYANVCKAIGALKRAPKPVIYALRETIYNDLVGLVGTDGHPVFQLDPSGTAIGTILGVPIKVEDAVAADTLLIGDGSKVVNAVVTDVMIESDRNIKSHVVTYSGYARSEAQLIDDKAFAVLTKN